jgi:hypothetical protein
VKKAYAINLLKVKSGHNPTFRTGDNWHLNACVGTNTGGDPRDGYLGGFQAGAEVLLAAAGVSRPEGASESWGMPNVDYLVYPVCLCARHHIELSLKLAIPLAWNIFKRRSPQLSEGLKEPGSQDVRHGLKPIWESLSAISKNADKRLAKAVSGLEGIIEDFNLIDPDGQVFRYATNLESLPNIVTLTHINFQTFADRYSQLSEALEKLHILLGYLTSEYATGSFTAELNREELLELAELLPNRDTWKTKEFKSIKKQLISSLGLSSNAFTRALDKIQETPALSFKIGVVNELTTINAATFEKIKLAAEGKFKVEPGFSSDERIAISALFKMSEDVFAEYYEWFARPLPEDEEEAAWLENEREWSYVARKAFTRPDRLLYGLKQLGQTELATQLCQVLSDRFEALDRIRNEPVKPFDTSMLNAGARNKAGATSKAGAIRKAGAKSQVGATRKAGVITKAGTEPKSRATTKAKVKSKAGAKNVVEAKTASALKSKSGLRKNSTK